jgi:raffinose/stachyose/melibiose transport system substrate-binding protein
MKGVRLSVTALTLFVVLMFVVIGCAPSAPQQITLQMWHFAANKEAVYQEWIADYAKVAPNVTIKTNVIPKDSYNQTLAAALISGKPPDLMHGLPLGEPLQHFTDGQTLDLTPSIDDAWKKAMYPSSLSYLTINGKVLSVSEATNNAQVLYNQDRFDELGIKAPIATMKDLQDAVKKLRGKGYGGALYWAQANDQAPTLFINWAQQMYPDQWKAAELGAGRWDIPEFTQLMTEINSYSDVWEKGIASMSLDESVNNFVTGKASIFVTGNWAVASIVKGQPKFKIGVFPVPALNAKTRPAAMGSMAGTWMVSSKVPKAQQDAAIAFLRWGLLNKQGAFVKAIGLCPLGPAGESALATAEPLAQALCKEQVNSVPRDMFDVAARDSMSQAIQGMLNGQATPADVMKAAQDAKAKTKK